MRVLNGFYKEIRLIFEASDRDQIMEDYNKQIASDINMTGGNRYYYLYLKYKKKYMDLKSRVQIDTDLIILFEFLN